jgi:hypothetical protein
LFHGPIKEEKFPRLVCGHFEPLRYVAAPRPLLNRRDEGVGVVSALPPYYMYYNVLETTLLVLM